MRATCVAPPRWLRLACGLILIASSVASGQQPAGQEDARPAAASPPQLRLETGGPIALVTSLAFSPTSDALWVGGGDKRAEAWKLAADAERWQRDASATFRIPIGPALLGEINAMAMSHDGEQLAVGGLAPPRGQADWQHPGWEVPTVGLDEDNQDRGTIYVFDIRTRQVRTLRGHRGAVLALVYVAPARGRPRCLVSAAAERDENNSSRSNLVVRLWNTDVADDKARLGPGYLAGVKAAPCPPRLLIRPAIAAWRFGTRPEQVGVALANDLGRPDEVGQLCLVNMEAQRTDSIADGYINRTVIYLPDAGQLLTGSLNKLKSWNMRGWPAQRPTVLRELPLAASAGQFLGLAPVAMALVPEGNQAPAKRLALVSRYVFERGGQRLEDDRLQLVDLATFQKLGEASSLWRQGKTPALAVSRDGRHLAVTGSQTHEVQIYATSDLGRPQVKPRQVLRGEGERFVDAAFVSNGQRLGLLLIRADQPKQPGRLPRQPQPGDLVFDADRGEVTGELGGWQTLAPDASWRVESGQAADAKGKTRRFLRVRHATFQGAPIWLPPDDNHKLSDYAVLPPGGGRPPLLAVATHYLGQPSLYLYDAQRGRRFRRLNGHVERLRSLAFHPNGNMLVSTADDQTVCVWSLVDWRESLGTRGALTGVGVEPRGGRLRVAANTEGEALADGQLRAGDLIEAILDEAGKRDRLTHPHDLYSSVLRLKPDASVTLFVSRGGAVRPMAVKVGQAIDQRLPLCSLFCIKKARDDGNQPDQVDWLGWSPSGAYDAGSPEIERRIGWHFNTGQPDAPVRYALAAEYARLRRAGLLQEVLHHPEKAPAPPPDPTPELSVWVDPNDPDAELPIAAVAGGPLRVANGDLTLRASVEGLEPGLIRSVGWRATGGELQPMAALDSSGREFAADLSAQPWRRGQRRFECVVATQDLQYPTLRKEIRLTLPPPAPPTIRILEPEKPTSTSDEKRLRLRAEISPAGKSDAPVEVTLLHFANGEQQRRRQWTDPTAIDEVLALQPGENRIRLTAVAGDAPPAEADQETAVEERKVYYQPTKPRLNLEVVTASGTKRVLAGQPADGESWLVDDDAVTIQGTIDANDDLAAAAWKWSDEEDWQPFDGFQPGGRQVAVRERVLLRPGRLGLETRAETAGRPASVGQGAVTIEWRPRLPRLGPVHVSPAQITEGADAAEVELRGEWQLDPRLQPFPLRVELWRDGAALEAPVEVDQARRTFRVKGPVSFAADNRFQLRVSNEWRAEMIDAPRVMVRRPPRIVDVDVPSKAPNAHVEVAFCVESPNDLDVREIRVNDLTLPAESARVEPRGPETTRWRVVAKNIPLKHGRNELTLTARNDHGWTVEPPTAVVVVPEPPPPLAEIAFESPTPDEPFAVPHCDVVFTVRSTTRLAQVELLRNGQRVAEVDVGQQQEREGQGFTLEQSIRVPLPRGGLHVLSVAATNDGGLQRRQRTVVYVPPPVLVTVDQVETVARIEGADRIEKAEHAVFRADLGEDGYRFPDLPTGSVRLSGTVSWQAGGGRSEPDVQVSVNGYRQLSEEPERTDEADAPGKRRWQARLCLNRKLNRVEIEVPGSARDAGARLSFQLGCLKPLDRQRLHLLVIGIGELDRDQLEKDALQAVQATNPDAVALGTGRKTFKTPAFDGLLFRPDIREIDPPGLKANIRGVLERIRTKQNREPGSDLFMLYYRGAEAVDDDGHFHLRTSLRDDRPDSGISGQELERLFERKLGAHLCLLDVQRQEANPGFQPANRRRPSDQTDPHTGVLRSAWLRAEDRPGDAWLVIWFRQAMAKKAATLADVRSEIDKVYRDFQAKYPAVLEWEPDIPSALNNLVLGTP